MSEGSLKEKAVEAMMSDAGSLSWIARQVDPLHSIHASRVQQVQRKPAREDIERTNSVVEEVRADPDRAIVFTKCLNWENMLLITIADCSHADSELYDEVTETLDPYRSQCAGLHFLATP